MSPLSKVRMSPSEDKKRGDITGNECQRNQQVRSDATVIEETAEPKRGRQDPPVEYPADQTTAEGVSTGRSQGVGLETTRLREPQSFSGGDPATSVGFVENQISGVWTDPGAREVSGEGQAQALEGECAETHDRRELVESPQSQEGCGPSTT